MSTKSDKRLAVLKERVEFLRQRIERLPDRHRDAEEMQALMWAVRVIETINK